MAGENLPPHRAHKIQETNCLFSGTTVAWVADTETGCRRPPEVLEGLAKGPVMSEEQLHVVSGTGQVGSR
jgi:hypothetical protein